MLWRGRQLSDHHRRPDAWRGRGLCAWRQGRRLPGRQAVLDHRLHVCSRTPCLPFCFLLSHSLLACLSPCLPAPSLLLTDPPRLIVIPLSFLRRLDSLKYTSVIALFSIAYLVILVVAHYIKGDTIASRGTVRVFQWAGPVSALAAFPVIVFAYTCHQNMFSILNEIANNSHFRTTTVIFASIGGACSLYILTGITGYLSYGDNIKGNIVSMYPTAAAATIGRFAMVILVMFSYPLQIHPCRASLDACAKWRPRRRSSSQESSPTRHSLVGNSASQPRQEMSDMRFAIVTTVLIVLSFITAMTVSSLSLVLAYVGSTGSTTISFILPGLFYYKISDPDSPHHQRLVKDEDDASEFAAGVEGGASREGNDNRDWRRGLLRNAALALAMYGVLVMVTCLGINIVFGASGH